MSINVTYILVATTMECVLNFSSSMRPTVKCRMDCKMDCIMDCAWNGLQNELILQTH